MLSEKPPETDDNNQPVNDNPDNLVTGNVTNDAGEFVYVPSKDIADRLVPDDMEKTDARSYAQNFVGGGKAAGVKIQLVKAEKMAEAPDVYVYYLDDNDKPVVHTVVQIGKSQSAVYYGKRRIADGMLLHDEIVKAAKEQEEEKPAGGLIGKISQGISKIMPKKDTYENSILPTMYPTTYAAITAVTGFVLGIMWQKRKQRR